MRESRLWMLHLICGGVMVIVLGIHYAVMHTSELLGMSRSEVLSFESVHTRAGSPFFVTVYLILLAAALYHGLYGLRSIIYEINGLGEGARKGLSVLIIICGWAFFALGAWAILTGLIG